jgi:hypothetical protein
MMAECDLVTFETMGEMKQAFSPLPGAKETGVFSILRAVRPYSDISEFNVVSKPFHFKKSLQNFGLPGIKAKVNVNRHEFVMGGDSFASLMEEMKE